MRSPLRLVALGALATLLGLAPAGCGGGAEMEVGPIPPVERLPGGATRGRAPKLPPGHPPAGASEEPAALPPGHPPLGSEPAAAPRAAGADSPGAAGSAAADAELPLKPTGGGSAEELARALAGTRSEAARKHFERGFRFAFTSAMASRRYDQAETELRRAIELDPSYAEAYRALAYAVFNMGLDYARSLPLYEKAIELKPDYGEAHYALAFMLGESDPRRGAEHFRKAMQLGVKDERNLRARYYAGVTD